MPRDLRRVAAAFHTAAVDDTLPSLFRRVLDDFRTNYILRYSPRGVTSAGWHEITATLPGRPGSTIRARQGYEGK